MIHQLRIYGLYDDTKAAFHDRFRDHAWRIMKSYGFEILAFWDTETAEGPAFVYLLRWPDEQTLRNAWEQFMADEEWKQIKRDTAAANGPMVRDILADHVLVPTDYSPLLST